MKLHPKLPPLINSRLALTLLLTGFTLPLAAITPGEWHRIQTLDAESEGLVRVDLPPGTLDAARPELEDLRLIDATGKEVPYLIEREIPGHDSTVRAREFKSIIDGDTTVITVETGVDIGPLLEIILQTPARDFVKAMKIEGSDDSRDWREIAAGQTIFRLPGGAEKLRIPFAGGTQAWKYLRLTIADDRSPPVPFTGASLEIPGTVARSKPVNASIKSRDENPGVTRLAIDLGASNLPVAFVRIETPGQLFTRTVTFSESVVTEAGICERPLGRSVIYRVNAGGKSEERLEIPVEQTIHGRELLLLIRNEDSPPLAVSGIHVERRLTRLVFYTNGPGRYTLLTGNSQCSAPVYDVQALESRLGNSTAQDAGCKLGGIIDNPAYKSPEHLVAVSTVGANIDPAEWPYRKLVRIEHAGVQQLELDPGVLAHAASGARDVRLVRDGAQVPFLFDRPSISREVPLVATIIKMPDPKRPSLSRWSLKLPKTGLPVTRLVCTSQSPLFERNMNLWEEVTDERGEKFIRDLGSATWSRTPETPAETAREFSMTIYRPPSGDTIYLETDNGDNAAIDLADFRCCHPVTRLVFSSGEYETRPLWLYYGNRDAPEPHYDLSMVSRSFLRAEKSAATLGKEEPASGAKKTEQTELTGRGTLLFWGALGLVVIVLLVVVSRLLPKPPADSLP